MLFPVAIVARGSRTRHESMNKSLLKNTAITLGRLGLVAPDLTSALLGSFVQAWCIVLRSIRDDIEKEHAFHGLVRMIRHNPHAPLNALMPLCDAFVSWCTPPVKRLRFATTDELCAERPWSFFKS